MAPEVFASSEYGPKKVRDGGNGSVIQSEAELVLAELNRLWAKDWEGRWSFPTTGWCLTFTPPSSRPDSNSRPAISPQGKMVWIEGGSFTMGSPLSEVDRKSNEGPQTSVTISGGFWMGIYEVTQAEYQAVIGSNPSVFTGDVNRPVDHVNWNAAMVYCAALTTSERAAGRCPADWAYRLPTEAEWEYACRAGTTTRFSHGDDRGDSNLGNYAWYSRNSSSTTHPVGEKAPNAWGLYDMHGNIWEWCQDSWDGSANYPGGSTIDPLVTTGSFRVLRGGAWSSFAGGAGCAYRGYGERGFAISGYGGFRAVLAPVQP